jgi:hypothetical protein
MADRIGIIGGIATGVTGSQRAFKQPEKSRLARGGF